MGAHGASPGLAAFSVVTTGLTLAAVVISPAAYLLFPLLFTVDLVPRGLRETVGPKINVVGWRDLLRHIAQDFEHAAEQAAMEAEQRRKQPAGEAPPAGESASSADS